MSRTRIVCSLGLLAGCSFVDDFDKFHSADKLEPSHEGGVNTTDGAAPGADGGDARAPDADTSLVDAGIVDASGTDAAPDDGGPSAQDDANVTPACSSCDDGDPCTLNMCDPGSGCSYPIIDGDRDGFSPGTCKVGSSARGGDCDDNNNTVKPGATEICDNLDNDCNTLTDEGFTKLLCFPDVDRDGYPNLDATAQQECAACPSGSLAVAAPGDRSRHDCYDVADAAGERVFPGQTNYYEEGYGPGSRNERSFDYDCSGIVEPAYKALGGTCSGLLGLLCEGAAGFSGMSLPGCGETGSYTTCGTNGLTCTGNTESRKQLCH